jgi:CoA:oxalate CoA-transferase
MKPALAGLTVVDFSELLPGPFLTQNLCELGADVIKIERPPHGDNARHLAPGVFASVNRGKRSIVADLKQDADRAKVRALIARADIVVETYRPGVMARLGLDYASLAEDHPGLIYTSLTGYGQEGPMAQMPGHDLNYLALAGAFALSGAPEAEPAHVFGLPVADLCGAMYGLSAILAALHQRRDTGIGQHLDIAIADCAAHWLNPRIGHFREAGLEQLADQRQEVFLKPAYGIFGTRDGHSLSICALEDQFWARLLTVFDLSPFDGAEYASHAQRGKAAAAINQVLARAVLGADAAVAEQWLRDADVPVAPVIAPLDVAAHAQFAARGLTVETPYGAFARFPVRLAGNATVTHCSPTLNADAGALR